jgi:hypothetical protein
MIAAFHNIETSKFWRAAYFACMPFVVSYILFELLDLDGSKLPRPLPPVETSAIIAERIVNPERHNSRDTANPWAKIPLLFTDHSGEFSLLLHTKTFSFSPFVFTRSHGYPVGLPRDDLPD